ncbi:MAG: hypothetical protein ACKOEM_14360 [Planctomycetia bacterium]
MLLLMLTLVAAVAGAEPVTVYVAPNGSDAASGREPQTPVATIARAQEIARAARQGSTDGYKLVLRGGTYYLPQTVTFGPEDSGSQEVPTQLVAFGGEQVRLVAGRDLSQEVWQPWKGRIKQLDLTTVGLGGRVFRQLFCGRERQAMARTPNFDPSDPHGGKWALTEAAAEAGSKRVFKYAAGDMKPWADLSQAEVFIFHSYNYYATIVPLVAVDAAGRVARLGQDTYDVIQGDGAERYFVQGLFEELDAPGEWHLDRKNSVLSFWPPDGSSESATPIEVPLAEHVVAIDGAKHVLIRGLTLEVSEGGAVDIHGATACRVVGCKVGHCGVGGRSEAGRHGRTSAAWASSRPPTVPPSAMTSTTRAAMA